jgi:hypothetical protein
MKKLISDHIQSQPNFSIKDGGPGLHAEVQAVNDIFNELAAHGIDPVTFDLRRIEVATYKTNGKYVGEAFPACKNCDGILIEPINILTRRISDVKN